MLLCHTTVSYISTLLAQISLKYNLIQLSSSRNVALSKNGPHILCLNV